MTRLRRSVIKAFTFRIFIAVTLAMALASPPGSRVIGKPTGLPARDEVVDFFSYDSNIALDVTETPVVSSPWYREYEISYSNLGDMVYAPFMVPNVPGTASEGMHPVPCLVGLHGMFSNSANQFWSIADFCAKRGIAVMTPSLPYHHKRTKNALYVQGLQLIIGSPEEVRDNLRRAVIDTRRALDWLATRSDIDQNCISIAGVSLGGIVASLAFKVEPRFANGVLVVSGSGAGGILENGDTAILNIFRAAAKANVVDPEDFVDALQIVDPINVPDLQPRPVLVMNGMSDVIMVPENAVRLRDSFVLAEQIWTTGGHYFPLYVSEYLLMDYLSKQYTKSPSFSHGIRVDAGLGFRFTEEANAPEIGADNLWVDVAVELGRPDKVAAHRVSVPMVNRAVPVIALSKDTYSALAPYLTGRHLPAFIYIINHDSPIEICAALAYAQVLGLPASPQFYYISPLTGEAGGYSIGAAFPMDVSRIRNMLESVARVPGANGVAGSESKASSQIPLDVFAEIQDFPGPAAPEAIGSWLARETDVSRLKSIHWFPNYPHDDPCWSAGPGM